MLSNLFAISEFSKASDGRSFNGTCTWAAAAMALASQQGTPTNTQGVVDLMVSMRDSSFARGECAYNGGATIAHVGKELRLRHADILLELDYEGGPLHEDVRSILAEHAGRNPIVFQVLEAHNLKNTQNQPCDTGVHAHAFLVAEHPQPATYICLDPNMPVLREGYTLDSIMAAQPSGLIILKGGTMPSSFTPLPGGGYLGPPAPDGKRYTVKGGILLACQQFGVHFFDNGNTPIEEIRDRGSGLYTQNWHTCGLYWRSNTDCGLVWVSN